MQTEDAPRQRECSECKNMRVSASSCMHWSNGSTDALNWPSSLASRRQDFTPTVALCYVFMAFSEVVADHPHLRLRNQSKNCWHLLGLLRFSRDFSCACTSCNTLHVQTHEVQHSHLRNSVEPGRHKLHPAVTMLLSRFSAKTHL
eukprot:scpid82478/ scgid28648/ 